MEIIISIVGLVLIAGLIYYVHRVSYDQGYRDGWDDCDDDNSMWFNLLDD